MHVVLRALLVFTPTTTWYDDKCKTVHGALTNKFNKRTFPSYGKSTEIRCVGVTVEKRDNAWAFCNAAPGDHTIEHKTYREEEYEEREVDVGRAVATTAKL